MLALYGSGRSISWEKALSTHCIRVKVGPTAGLDAMIAERKIHAPAGNRNPVVQPVRRLWANMSKHRGNES